jgi:hypothetical protein
VSRQKSMIKKKHRNSSHTLNIKQWLCRWWQLHSPERSKPAAPINQKSAWYVNRIPKTKTRTLLLSSTSNHLIHDSVVSPSEVMINCKIEFRVVEHLHVISGTHCDGLAVCHSFKFWCVCCLPPSWSPRSTSPPRLHSRAASPVTFSILVI